MNKFIKDIIDKNCSDKQKKKELDKLNNEIEKVFYLENFNIVKIVTIIISQNLSCLIQKLKMQEFVFIKIPSIAVVMITQMGM